MSARTCTRAQRREPGHAEWENRDHRGRLRRQTGKRIIFQPECIGETPAHPRLDHQAQGFSVLGGPMEDASPLADLYKRLYHAAHRFHFCPALVAELAKYMENAFYAVKVTFCSEWYEPLASSAEGAAIASSEEESLVPVAPVGSADMLIGGEVPQRLPRRHSGRLLEEARSLSGQGHPRGARVRRASLSHRPRSRRATEIGRQAPRDLDALAGSPLAGGRLLRRMGRSVPRLQVLPG
jgi:hypothetical protein